MRRVRTRRRHSLAAIVLGVLLALVAVWAVTTAGGGSHRRDARETTDPGRTTTWGTQASGTPAGGGADSLAVLARLKVKGRAPLTGYARARFGPAWTDDNGASGGHNGCDTRNDVLHRDLVDVTVRPGTHDCVVLTGVLRDPYSGRAIHFTRGVRTSSAIQIDHVVALADAWQTGAQQLSATRRVDLANDPINLLAVDGSLNEAKGAGDAATWLPPNKSFRCSYVARQVAVKARYGLWVTRAEHDAIARVLSSCPAR